MTKNDIHISCYGVKEVHSKAVFKLMSCKKYISFSATQDIVNKGGTTKKRKLSRSFTPSPRSEKFRRTGCIRLTNFGSKLPKKQASVNSATKLYLQNLTGKVHYYDAKRIISTEFKDQRVQIASKEMEESCLSCFAALIQN